MNSVVPSCRLNSFSARVSGSGSVSDRRAPLWVCTAGRGWSVGSSRPGHRPAAPSSSPAAPPAPLP